MRIYAVADIHGKDSRFAKIEVQLARHQPDILVVAGDLVNYRHPGPVLTRLNALPLPVLVIRGNTDLKRVENLFRFYPNLRPLHLSPVMIQGVPLVGLSGTVPVPFRSRIRFRERDLFKRAATLVTSQTVLVAHPPPYGFLDEVAGRFHAGSRRLFDLVTANQPAFLLCGHIHERPGIIRMGRSIVVNCNVARDRAGALIDIRPGRSRAATLL
jgi:Icc-related predicted phosphoesterase